MKKYSVIYADPPWQFKNYNDKKAKNWAGDHYNLMTTDDICKLPIKNISDDDCILFIWGTWPKLPDCLEVIKQWGFTYKTLGFNWYKENKDKSLFLGMGYWTRSNSEYCLLATKGKPKRVNANVFQVVQYPRMKHSEKPSIIRNKIVYLVGDLPRIELFAREKTEGWDVWGNEVESDIDLLSIAQQDVAPEV
jgi:N6-adenosine-specific RNA methylase IME4